MSSVSAMLHRCLFCTKPPEPDKYKYDKCGQREISVKQYKPTIGLGECLICYEDMKPDTNISLISCGHYYHAWCLNSWFLKRPVCPICQVKLSD